MFRDIPVLNELGELVGVIPVEEPPSPVVVDQTALQAAVDKAEAAVTILGLRAAFLDLAAAFTPVPDSDAIHNADAA